MTLIERKNCENCGRYVGFVADGRRFIEGERYAGFLEAGFAYRCDECPVTGRQNPKAQEAVSG